MNARVFVARELHEKSTCVYCGEHFVSGNVLRKVMEYGFFRLAHNSCARLHVARELEKKRGLGYGGFPRKRHDRKSPHTGG